MAIRTIPWDPAEHLTNKKAIAACINAALEDGDPALIAAALGDVARAKGMTKNCPRRRPDQGELLQGARRRCQG